jgi:hypothetical protein
MLPDVAHPQKRIKCGPRCALCDIIIRSGDHSRPYSGGRAHNKCILRASQASLRASAPAASPDAQPSPSDSQPAPRSKRPYESLQRTQQYERRTRARIAVEEVVQEIGVPLEVIIPPPKASLAAVLHLSTSERDRIRTVKSLKIPGEKQIAKFKEELARSHGTETGTFSNGAYIVDPIRFVTALCEKSTFIAVGGDKGGGHTKLGITYSIADGLHFAPLLIYDGDDDWDSLDRLRQPSLTLFSGDSAVFPHILAVLQHLINARNAFLNGDWLFVNAVLGLMSASSNNPCPICIVERTSLRSNPRYREAGDTHGAHIAHTSLLTIPPERIVPAPLHVFLGISNRIIFKAFSKLLGKENVRATVGGIKTVHRPGCGGLSDLHDLNGPEIAKWIKTECSTKVLAAASNGSTIDPSVVDAHHKLASWLEKLHQYLLHADTWTESDIESFRAVVQEIFQKWRSLALDKAFPKLHMLHHTVEFAARHRFLGRASEARIESFHAYSNALFHHHHFNRSCTVDERLRRCLADSGLRAVQPMLLLHSEIE